MKAVCIRRCQVIIEGGKIKYFAAGDVSEFEKCPPHFEALETRSIDFIKASEAELLESKWKFSDAQAAILKEYDIELTREEGTKKSDIVKQILDAKFRSADN